MNTLTQIDIHADEEARHILQINYVGLTFSDVLKQGVLSNCPN